MTGTSDALRYLKKECPALLYGTLSERVRGLTSWAERHQGQGRAAIYERIAMAVALDLLFGANRHFIFALSSKPLPVGEDFERKKIRVFMEAVHNCGSAPDRYQQQRISRDVRAALYLINNEISPQAVRDLANRYGEGVQAWAAKYTDQKGSDVIDLDAVENHPVLLGDQPQEVEIIAKIGRGKRQFLSLKLRRSGVDAVEKFLEQIVNYQDELEG